MEQSFKTAGINPSRNENKPENKNRFLILWLIIGLIAGFASVLFFSITYLNEKVLCDLDCRLRNEVSIALILVSLFAMFVGSLTYYFISERYERKITKIHKDSTVALNFLENDDRKVVRSIIKRRGSTSQSMLAKDTGLSRVKISRILNKLQKKDIIIKISDGMTNKVELDDKYKHLFLA